MEIKYQKAFGYVSADRRRFPSTDDMPVNKNEKKTDEIYTDSSSEGIMPDFSSIANDSNVMSFSLHNNIEEEEKPKRKRKSNMGKPVTESEDGESQFPEEEPYEKKYEETTNALKIAVAQLDASLSEMQKDVTEIRASKVLKSKYTNLANIQQTMGQFINTKVTALREINNTISKCADLELKRKKDLMIANSEQNSDKNIMDMYSAFISMPTGAENMGTNPLGPTVSQITMNNGIVSDSINDEDAGMQNYLNTMNPAQRLSLYENDPNVQHVVVYDSTTGAKHFEVMNVITGEVIPNVDKRDMMFMEDVVLDLQTGVATNINLNETYPIIEVGNRVSDSY